jgi:hypothetical protein
MYGLREFRNVAMFATVEPTFCSFMTYTSKNFPFTLLSSKMLCRVVRSKLTDLSQKPASSLFRQITSSTFKTKAADSPEPLASLHQATLRHIQKDNEFWQTQLWAISNLTDSHMSCSKWSPTNVKLNTGQIFWASLGQGEVVLVLNPLAPEFSFKF